MPLENLEEEGLPKNPDLRIAQLKFLLMIEEYKQDVEIKTELMEAIKHNSEYRSIKFHFIWGLGEQIANFFFLPQRFAASFTSE